MSLATVIGETHRRFVQKFARFPSGARRKAREREKRKKGSDPSLLFIQSRKNEPWEKEGWLVLEEGGQGMMSAVIETEKIGGERERERRGRKREKVGVEGGTAGGRRRTVESRKVSTPIVVHRDFRGLGILFYAGSRKRL